ncbi:MAG: histidine triad nucleotide-binding protein [Burkholderiales bacterium]
MENCIFCKIAKGEIPSKKVYEDGEILAFHDINPVAPVHFMLIPKQHVESLAHVGGMHHDILGKLMVLAPKLADKQGCKDGFRTIINTGRVARQEVLHLHIHVIGGPEVLPPMLYRAKPA